MDFMDGKKQRMSARMMNSKVFFFFFLFLLLAAGGCARHENRLMEVTAYCGCGKCCGWERGAWKHLKLDVWNRYVSKGKQEGKKYSGLTASGTKPQKTSPGLLSGDTLAHPWTAPYRLICPWRWFSEDGTIAADTKYYPFGTRMLVPGYGWGVVTDRGSAIKGPNRIDLYYNSHQDALDWGRKKVRVRIER